jgi:hypothetical protein
MSLRFMDGFEPYATADVTAQWTRTTRIPTGGGRSMAAIPARDGDALRHLVRQRLAARSHWMVLLSDDERYHAPEILTAIDAHHPDGAARVRVDLWAIDLHAVDADAGTTEDLGAVLIVSWPRAAMLIEVLHAVLARLFGHTPPVAQLLERPILVPVATSALPRTGAQLHALQDWLFQEDDG